MSIIPAIKPDIPGSSSDLAQEPLQPAGQSRWIYCTKVFISILLSFILYSAASNLERWEAFRSWLVQDIYGSVVPEKKISPVYDPIPPGIELGECIKWDDYSDVHEVSSISVSLSLDDSARDLLFVSRGQLASGTFRLTQSNTGNRINVNATVSTSLEYKDIKICKVVREDGAVGVGIFAPSNSAPRYSPCNVPPNISFNVDLPMSMSSLNSLETDLPRFRQSLTDLTQEMFFHKLKLQSASYQPISVESTSGENIKIKTQGGVSGRFTANSSFSVEGEAEDIDVELNLVNDDIDRPTLARVKGVQRSCWGCQPVLREISELPEQKTMKISTNLTIPDNRGGAFDIAATSPHSFSIKVGDAPLDSVINIAAGIVGDNVTSGWGDLEVHLPSTYEGNFLLHLEDSEK
ncbi:hypothetical protein CC2G_008454 [Coprinopsis cinerea AmutBmut pab1-1]|nr:hypothetical protein CC2G_008454 [Coprinopsis cinerea AmutBmut pab1-1]